jgi:hypothetical protein
MRLEISADQSVIDGLIQLMEGQIEEFDFKAEGGSYEPAPTELNTIRIAVRNPEEGVSCSFRVPHIKPGKDGYTDLEGSIVGKFTAHWNTEVKATEMAIVYDKSEESTS